MRRPARVLRVCNSRQPPPPPQPRGDGGGRRVARMLRAVGGGYNNDAAPAVGCGRSTGRGVMKGPARG